MVSPNTFTFGGEAGQLLGEYKKLENSDKSLQRQILTTQKAAETASRMAAAALNQQSEAVKKLTGQNDALKKKLDELKTQQEEAGAFSKAAWMGVATVIGTKVVSALKQALDLQIAYNKELAQSKLQQDEVGRKLQVQALLDNETFQKTVKPRVAQAAQKAAVPIAVATQAATELVSQGFDIKEATGSGLDELLIGAQATNSADKVQFATAVASFLKGQGKKLDAKNVQSVTAPLAGLFQGTAIQAGDLQALAKIGSMLTEFKVDQASGLASFDVLKHLGNTPEEASTGIRNIVSTLKTAGANAPVKAALEKIGGKELLAATDLEGEEFPDVLNNLDKALSKLDDKSRSEAMRAIFGQENAGKASALLSNLPMMNDFLRIQGSDTALKEGANIATQGEVARSVRMANEREMRLSGMAGEQSDIQALIEAVKMELEAGGTNQLSIAAIEKALQVSATTGDYSTVLNKAESLAPDSVDKAEATVRRSGRGTEVESISGAIDTSKIPIVLRDFSKKEKGTKKVDFLEEGSEEDKEIKRMQTKLHELQIKVEEAKLAATAPGSEGGDGGKKITKGEQAIIDILQRQVDLDEVAIKKKDVVRDRNAGL